MKFISDIDDHQWLISADAAPWLARAAAGDASSIVSLAADLRRHLSLARTHLVLEQVELRARARRKFAAAERMFFIRVGLEQATDEIVAAYKARRFATAARVADLCCGVGGDLMALARRGPAVGIDRDPIAALMAAANLRAAVESATPACAGSGDVVVADVATIDVQSFAAWHIDPDRRPAGRRTTRAELHEPAPAAIDRLRAQRAEGAVKLAPAATLPEGWMQEAEREWISRDGECRQLVCWFGALARDAGRRRATVIDHNEAAVRSIVGDSAENELPVASSLGAFLYEPDAAVLAADLAAALAAEHGLAVVTPGIAYLTGDSPVADAALARFAVREILPFDLRRLRDALRARRVGRLEIKKRGVAYEPERLRRELRLSGDEPAVLILLPIAGRPAAIIAERVT